MKMNVDIQENVVFDYTSNFRSSIKQLTNFRFSNDSRKMLVIFLRSFSFVIKHHRCVSLGLLIEVLTFKRLKLYVDTIFTSGFCVLQRVMPSCFFILLRFFLRVDGVVSRIFDTRIYHEFGARYIIREYTEKEKKFSEMPVSSPDICLTPCN